MNEVERTSYLREQYAAGGTLDDQLLLHHRRKSKRRSSPPANPSLIAKLQSRR